MRKLINKLRGHSTSYVSHLSDYEFTCIYQVGTVGCERENNDVFWILEDDVDRRAPVNFRIPKSAIKIKFM